MKKSAKIYIAGARGLVGSAIRRNLESKGYNNFVFSPHSKYDLRNQEEVERFFAENKPEYVFLAAAKVGGIVANSTYRAEFIYDNLMIASNIIHQSYIHKVKKLLFLGSSCIYPRNAEQPIKEEYLLTNSLEYTNEPYALAKIAGMKMAENYNLQYGTNYLSVMPTNLYGVNDNFDLEKSHVLPAIIRKMHLAKCLTDNNIDALRQDLDKNPIENITGKSSEADILEILSKYGITSAGEVQVELWGTGTPLREFLYSDDLADACVYIMNNINFEDILRKEYNISNPEYPLLGHNIKNTHINIGVGNDLSIKDLAIMVKNIVGFEGKIYWNTSKPDGTPRKVLDISKLKSYSWQPKIALEDGIVQVYKNYIS